MWESRGRVVEVGSLAELDARLARGARSLEGWRVASVDLTDRGDVLAACDVAGATFLGCRFALGVEAVLEARGALVFPELAASPVDPYRSRLYSPADLYDAPAYRDSFDARAYAWFRTTEDDDALLARALHDHAVDRALDAWTAGRRLVGVMGGHAVRRGSPAYASAARLGRTLGDAHVVATGGGPGAMEAANLGAYLAAEHESALDRALADLAAVPGFRPSVDAWVGAARGVASRHEGSESLGIPTWHYGHEPTNPFATTVAKYFHNPTREAILLQLCEAGIVFLPGAAGTVQEVFQDACENYYADPSSVAPMILLGRRYWTEELPVWPLLQALGRGRPMEQHLHLADSVEEVRDLLGASPPGTVSSP
ncbi:LOG family protein [Nocardioides sp. GCM10027113]|uniref:LOG family protein n=1 Tax=unclassified Nocardioides TaxID=2615069 RepID=UPI00360A4740